MVGDIHRNLIKGGIYIYPTTSSSPNGKLRLLYECNPMAFIVEQAGGVASDGFNRILEIEPTELHQRTSIFIGSSQMVKVAEDLMVEYSSEKNNAPVNGSAVKVKVEALNLNGSAD